MDEDYLKWKKDPSSENLSVLMNKYSRILNSELPKYKGNLPNGVIKSYGKKFMAESFKNYNPEKSDLPTHITSSLRQLHRLNYNTSSVFRMSEELQRGSNLFKQVYNDLEARYKREPSDYELSEELGWSPSKVARMNKQMKKEMSSSNLEFSPSYVSAGDPIIDYIYHDLDDQDKLIFKYRTGYEGFPILGVTDIAKKINLSPGSVSNRAAKIAKTLNDNIKV